MGTASEHFVLYQYQFLNTQNIVGAQFQTETPYYQPMPQATSPFPPVSAIRDPDFAVSCRGIAGNCANAWGVRYIGSHDIAVYGSGQYSFFNNYSTTCSTVEAGENCQSRIVELQGPVSNINIYNLNTIGSLSMIDRDGTSLARWSDNINTFAQTIAMFKSN